MIVMFSLVVPPGQCLELSATPPYLSLINYNDIHDALIQHMLIMKLKLNAKSPCM